MIESVLLVGVGGAIGAVGRYGVGKLVTTDQFPISTLIMNVIGSFLLGLVLFSQTSETMRLLVGVGVCGAFTTFSTFSVDIVRLIEKGKIWPALLHGSGNILLSVIAVGFARILVG